MLITCSSCNSKYLVNSADLKPNGRLVRCAKCGFDWFQSSDFIEENKEAMSLSEQQNNNKYSNKKFNNNNNTNSKVSNLPSTYVKDQKPSIINTLFLIFFLGAVVICFWLIRYESDNLIALTNFYIHEFYFNLRLIINDFTKVMHQILN